MAFRVGKPPDVAPLTAANLGPAQLWTVASPGYLSRRGCPQVIEELEHHDCIAFVPMRESEIQSEFGAGRSSNLAVWPLAFIPEESRSR